MRDGSTAVGFTKANCQNKKSPANMCPRGRVGGCYICLAAGQRRAAGGGVHGGSRPQQPADPSSQQRASREPAAVRAHSGRQRQNQRRTSGRARTQLQNQRPCAHTPRRQTQRPCAHTAARRAAHKSAPMRRKNARPVRPIIPVGRVLARGFYCPKGQIP